MNTKTAQSLRKRLYLEQRRLCYYCDIQMPYDLSTIDHLLPRSRGGDTSWGNCVVSCQQCNQQKADMDVATFLFIKKGIVSKAIHHEYLTGKDLIRLIRKWLAIKLFNL